MQHGESETSTSGEEEVSTVSMKTIVDANGLLPGEPHFKRARFAVVVNVIDLTENSV